MERSTRRLGELSSGLATALTQLRPGDLVIFVVAAFVISGFSYHAYGVSATPALVRIEAAGTTHLYPLAGTRTVKPLRGDGTCELLIEDQGVRVVSSDCPQRICVSMGRITTTSQWIACLPHQVFIEITGATPGGDGGTTVDAATY